METSQITLHEWQSKAWHSAKRFVFFCAGVQSGKTTFGSVWIMNESEQMGQGDYLIIAPTYKILQQSTMQKFHELVPRGWGVFNKSESTFRTIDGRTFFLRSAEHPESIEGITAKAIWADEASLMKADAWLMMQGRVSRTQGRILCTFTPIALNWIHKELEKDKERMLRGEPGDIEFIQFRSVDSPYFPREEFERARRMLTPTQFQLRYEGVFGKAEGLIYADFCQYNIVDDFAIPRDWTRAGGIDWGYNNPFVALEGDTTYFADPSGLQETEEMVALGFDVQPANNDVNMGIQKVNERIRPTTDDKRSIRLKIFKSCINTINEMSLYRHDKDKERPVKEDDHCMDALRYLVMGLDEWGSTGDIDWV